MENESFVDLSSELPLLSGPPFSISPGQVTLCGGNTVFSSSGGRVFSFEITDGEIATCTPPLRSNEENDEALISSLYQVVLPKTDAGPEDNRVAREFRSGSDLRLSSNDVQASVRSSLCFWNPHQGHEYGCLDVIKWTDEKFLIVGGEAASLCSYVASNVHSVSQAGSTAHCEIHTTILLKEGHKFATPRNPDKLPVVHHTKLRWKGVSAVRWVEIANENAQTTLDGRPCTKVVRRDGDLWVTKKGQFNFVHPKQKYEAYFLALQDVQEDAYGANFLLFRVVLMNTSIEQIESVRKVRSPIPSFSFMRSRPQISTNFNVQAAFLKFYFSTVRPGGVYEWNLSNLNVRDASNSSSQYQEILSRANNQFADEAILHDRDTSCCKTLFPTQIMIDNGRNAVVVDFCVLSDAVLILTSTLRLVRVLTRNAPKNKDSGESGVSSTQWVQLPNTQNDELAHTAGGGGSSIVAGKRNTKSAIGLKKNTSTNNNGKGAAMNSSTSCLAPITGSCLVAVFLSNKILLANVVSLEIAHSLDLFGKPPPQVRRNVGRSSANAIVKNSGLRTSNLETTDATCFDCEHSMFYLETSRTLFRFDKRSGSIRCTTIPEKVQENSIVAANACKPTPTPVLAPSTIEKIEARAKVNSIRGGTKAGITKMSPLNSNRGSKVQLPPRIDPQPTSLASLKPLFPSRLGAIGLSESVGVFQHGVYNVTNWKKFCSEKPGPSEKPGAPFNTPVPGPGNSSTGGPPADEAICMAAYDSQVDVLLAVGTTKGEILLFSAQTMQLMQRSNDKRLQVKAPILDMKVTTWRVGTPDSEMIVSILAVADSASLHTWRIEEEENSSVQTYKVSDHRVVKKKFSEVFMAAPYSICTQNKHSIQFWTGTRGKSTTTASYKQVGSWTFDSGLYGLQGRGLQYVNSDLSPVQDKNSRILVYCEGDEKIYSMNADFPHTMQGEYVMDKRHIVVRGPVGSALTEAAVGVSDPTSKPDDDVNSTLQSAFSREGNVYVLGGGVFGSNILIFRVKYNLIEFHSKMPIGNRGTIPRPLQIQSELALSGAVGTNVLSGLSDIDASSQSVEQLQLGSPANKVLSLSFVATANSSDLLVMMGDGLVYHVGSYEATIDEEVEIPQKESISNIVVNEVTMPFDLSELQVETANVENWKKVIPTSNNNDRSVASGINISGVSAINASAVSVASTAPLVDGRNAFAAVNGSNGTTSAQRDSMPLELVQVDPNSSIQPVDQLNMTTDSYTKLSSPLAELNTTGMSMQSSPEQWFDVNAMPSWTSDNRDKDCFKNLVKETRPLKTPRGRRSLGRRWGRRSLVGLPVKSAAELPIFSPLERTLEGPLGMDVLVSSSRMSPTCDDSTIIPRGLMEKTSFGEDTLFGADTIIPSAKSSDKQVKSKSEGDNHVKAADQQKKPAGQPSKPVERPIRSPEQVTRVWPERKSPLLTGRELRLSPKIESEGPSAKPKSKRTSTARQSTEGTPQKSTRSPKTFENEAKDEKTTVPTKPVRKSPSKEYLPASAERKGLHAETKLKSHSTIPRISPLLRESPNGKKSARGLNSARISPSLNVSKPQVKCTGRSNAVGSGKWRKLKSRDDTTSENVTSHRGSVMFVGNDKVLDPNDMSRTSQDDPSNSALNLLRFSNDEPGGVFAASNGSYWLSENTQSRRELKFPARSSSQKAIQETFEKSYIASSDDGFMEASICSSGDRMPGSPLLSESKENPRASPSSSVSSNSFRLGFDRPSIKDRLSTQSRTTIQDRPSTRSTTSGGRISARQRYENPFKIPVFPARNDSARDDSTKEPSSSPSFSVSDPGSNSNPVATAKSSPTENPNGLQVGGSNSTSSQNDLLSSESAKRSEEKAVAEADDVKRKQGSIVKLALARFQRLESQAMSQSSFSNVSGSLAALKKNTLADRQAPVSWIPRPGATESTSSAIEPKVVDANSKAVDSTRSASDSKKPEGVAKEPDDAILAATEPASKTAESVADSVEPCVCSAERASTGGDCVASKVCPSSAAESSEIFVSNTDGQPQEETSEKPVEKLLGSKQEGHPTTLQEDSASKLEDGMTESRHAPALKFQDEPAPKSQTEAESSSVVGKSGEETGKAEDKAGEARFVTASHPRTPLDKSPRETPNNPQQAVGVPISSNNLPEDSGARLSTSSKSQQEGTVDVSSVLAMASSLPRADEMDDAQRKELEITIELLRSKLQR